ncbi:High-affinity zinc uptake system membrane protein znuB [Peptoniphilus harei]|uniref:metal ABC transporter permease n=1 Tax=Peptoniphilus harei TaxID=54005 RepID=UPI000F70FF90|nr:metal ABC transporter permease [Peptoniphilus harei]QQE46588.1 metal ABC transporter permease [Peptoniphilus harei]VEJ35558.1 High-affinity zinc uptake system membrane protein znuB [Peptoniphilus harei]
MLQYSFMIRTLLVSLMISIIIPLIGIVIVNRGTSMMGDALSHVSLAGVALGLILSINPLIGAIFACVIGAFSIEKIRKKFPQFGDMATAIITSMGLGLAALLSDFSPGGSSFDAYLFGSIASVSKTDLIIVLITFILVVAISLIYYFGLLSIAVDPQLAKMSGVNVRRINSIFTLLSALTIALSAKIIGALMVTSLIVLPVASSLLISKSYKTTFLNTLVLGVLYTLSGVILSYYFDLKPGGAIVVIASLGMLVCLLISKLKSKK